MGAVSDIQDLGSQNRLPPFEKTGSHSRPGSSDDAQQIEHDAAPPPSLSTLLSSSVSVMVHIFPVPPFMIQPSLQGKNLSVAPEYYDTPFHVLFK
jgi:hypothetical protein